MLPYTYDARATRWWHPEPTGMVTGRSAPRAACAVGFCLCGAGTWSNIR